MKRTGNMLKRSAMRRPEGTYTAIILDFGVEDYAGGERLVIEMKLTDETGWEEVVRDRINENRLPYFEGALLRQIDRDFNEIEQMLEYCTEHSFTVCYSYDKTYGDQYDYRG